MHSLNIVKDGIVSVNRKYVSSSTSFFVSGVTGGETIEPIMFNSKGDPVAVLDADNVPVVLSDGSQDRIHHGRGNIMYLRVTNTSSSTAVVVNCFGYD